MHCCISTTFTQCKSLHSRLSRRQNRSTVKFPNFPFFATSFRFPILQFPFTPVFRLSSIRLTNGTVPKSYQQLGCWVIFIFGEIVSVFCCRTAVNTMCTVHRTVFSCIHILVIQHNFRLMRRVFLKCGSAYAVSYTHLTLPTNREV